MHFLNLTPGVKHLVGCERCISGFSGLINVPCDKSLSLDLTLFFFSSENKTGKVWRHCGVPVLTCSSLCCIFCFFANLPLPRITVVLVLHPTTSAPAPPTTTTTRASASKSVDSQYGACRHRAWLREFPSCACPRPPFRRQKQSIPRARKISNSSVPP